MDKSTLHMIQEVLSFPLEEHFRILQDIDNGVIKINNSRKLKQLKTLSQDHDREIARFRTLFLESIFIDNRSFEEAVVNFFLAIAKVKEKYSKSLKSLKADINQAESGRMPAYLGRLMTPDDPAFIMSIFKEVESQWKKADVTSRQSTKNHRNQAKNGIMTNFLSSVAFREKS